MWLGESKPGFRVLVLIDGVTYIFNNQMKTPLPVFHPVVKKKNGLNDFTLDDSVLNHSKNDSIGFGLKTICH